MHLKLSLITLLEAASLASALSIDAFIASFAYGSNKIKVPMLSIQIINLVCSCILGISIVAGTLIKQYIPDWLTIAICFTILFVLGVTKLLDSIIKSFIKKYNNFNKEISFSMFNLKFILNLYANPEDADIDASRTISPMEAASLAIALSLDGFTVGFGAALGNINGLAVFLSSLITDMVAVVLGVYLGNKIARKLYFNLSWLSGIVLIILAFLKL
ncbi:sporulation membrane protein YtaF [Sedimentibacter hydroxybenzoicus DSM 7310]|uniref:Sporulation membrane protein YtaF n=2 Tax=Sedimentibacter hydroxybenzoicus TaxID=29345 RepID=A0A974GVV8_SEDHY|nr:sporulation membrane protein YtaF [Sedimentibacter hydroxybenzoicus DSM 7310]